MPTTAQSVPTRWTASHREIRLFFRFYEFFRRFGTPHACSTGDNLSPALFYILSCGVRVSPENRTMTTTSRTAPRPGQPSAREQHPSPGSESDESLLLRVQQGDDPAAFETLVHRYERELYGFLRRYLGDAQLAEDVFQATFLRVHVKRHLFTEGRAFRPWLYAIATHQAIDARRRNRRHRMASLDGPAGHGRDGTTLAGLIAGGEPVAEDRLVEQEAKELMRAAVEKLPERMRRVLCLVWQQGMPYRDVAKLLGIPIGTVKSRVHSAVVRLGRLRQRAALCGSVATA
jgi:RNA polymerase sigma-70 factor (ECF subfamily)